MSQRKKMPMGVRSGDFVPGSFNAEKRTIDLVFTTGARVKRGGVFSDPWYEELAVDDKACRLDRLNSGAPLLNTHSQWSLNDVIGVVERAWIEGGKGFATVRFSEREDVKPIVADVAAGILRNISVGYARRKMTELEERAPDGYRVFRCIDWEPGELSFVPVPADAGAQVRSGADSEEVCEIVTRTIEEEKESMEKKTESGAPVVERGAEIDQNKIREEAVAAERKRVADIAQVVRSVNLEPSVADGMIAAGKSVEECRAEVIEMIAKRQEKTVSANVEVTRDGKETTLRGIENALEHRHNPSRNKLEEHGRVFRNMSLLDISREILEMSGVKTRGMDRLDIATRAMHSTSDFPLILANVLNKTLRDAYQAYPKTFAPFTREVFLADFKPVQRTQLGDAPVLDEVVEDAAITYGTVGEAAESYALKTFAKGFAITRKAIVNDDLAAFTRLPEMFGRRAAEKEADIVWGLITGNQVMADGDACFHANHKNLASAGAIAVATVGAGRALMRKQKGLNGSRINLMPKSIAVPVALESVMEAFLHTVIYATSDSAANPWKNTLTPIVEPRLDDASASQWYLFADPAQIDVVELGRLQGQTGPMIETEPGFDVEGIKMKCRIDLGARIIDFRGAFRNG